MTEGEKGENKTGAKFPLYTVYWRFGAQNTVFSLKNDSLNLDLEHFY